MSSAANLGYLGFAVEPGAGAIRGGGPSPGANGEKGTSDTPEGEFELELKSAQGLMPLAQVESGGAKIGLPTPVDIALSDGQSAAVPEQPEICDPTALERIVGLELPNLALQAIVGQVPIETPPASKILMQESIRARIATVVSTSPSGETPNGMASEVGQVQLQSTAQGLPVEPEAVAADRRRLASEEGNAARVRDGAKFELAAVSTETHRRELSVRERGTTFSGRDEAQAVPSVRPLMPVGGGASESGKSSGQSSSETPTRSDSFSDAVTLAQADQGGIETNGAASTVRAFDVPTMSKLIGEAADQLRSEASGQVYRTPSIIAPNAPSFVKSLSLEVLGDQGQSVRLRLSMHEDGIEVSLASADLNLMSMLNSERDQLMSTLNAVGHNVVAVRLDAVERPAAGSLAQNTEFDGGSGGSTGNQPHGGGASRNHPEGRKEHDRLKAPRDGDRSGLYV